MNRKINLIYNDNDKIEGLENVPMSDISQVFPYSCEILVCRHFNIFEQHQSEEAMNALLEKIKPNGQLVIGVVDLSNICEDYINKKIKSTLFFDYIKHCRNPIGVDDVIEYVQLNNQYFIVEIVTQQNYIHFITLSKQG